MQITVVGTINKDLILPFNDVPIESFGGIFYNVHILSQLAPQATILPVSYVGEDVLETVNAILDKIPNVEKTGLIPLPQTNHKVILEYASPLKRNEKALFPFPTLKWDHIKSFLNSDMIVVNMITGWDIDLETFEKLCRDHHHKVYLDFHYLATTIDKLGRRVPHVPENLEKWLSGPRFLQMNEEEFETLNVNKLSEKEFFNTYLQDDQVLMISKSNKGVSVVYHKGGITGERHYPAYKIPKLVDSTGCGDAFGAAFVVKFLETGDILASVEYGNLVAAANATLRGTNEMYRLADMVKTVRELNG
jgi:adenosine kinase